MKTVYPIWLIHLPTSFFNRFGQRGHKTVAFATIISLVGITSYPLVAAAGFFSSPAAAATPRSESLQTLPILQARLSPMLLTNVGGPDPILDEDTLSADVSVYDIGDVVIPERDTISTYVVQPGDTLSEIASQFGVSPNTIRWANNIPARGGISVGQQLVILPITGVRHKVKKGDTLVSIAKKYKADADDIASFNGFDPGEALVPGTDIIVPDGEISVPTPTKPSKSGSFRSPAGSGGSSVSNGYFTRPVPGGILTQGYHDHYHALDISIPGGHATGTPILAAAAGTVIVADSTGYNGGYGEVTIIQHDNGTQTLYAHQSKIFVHVGDHVEQGQKIGAIGSTGHSTGPHLHWEVRGALTPMLY